MAPPAGTIRPGRYLAFFLLIVVALYGLVFFTGDREPAPRLGIDLKGGTSVTLTARTPDGSKPTRESLNQARAIIGERVNGLGVNGAEVVLDGTQIVITVPGDEGEQAKTLGQTAKLGFRKVVAGPFDPAALADAGKGGQQGDGKTEPGKGDAKDDGAKDDGKQDENTGGGSAVAGAAQDADDSSQVDPGLPEETQKEITEARKLRQSEDLLAQGPEAQAALEKAIKSLDCGKGKQDPLRGNDDPKLPLVACDQDRASTGKRSAYLLGPVILDGQMIKDSTSSVNQDGIGHQVNIEFTNAGSAEWAKITSEMAKESAQQPQDNPARVSFVMDTEVVSAPSVTQAIAGNTRITGDFSQVEAQSLAEILKYGSLPLSFETSDASTVSATLGLSSLKAGLIAGAIGFAMIVLYSLVYYRLLGILLIASLALTAALVYPVIILLGRSVGFTLDIAGVAGLIIAIGVTADSFIVYFERLKDEIRGGRTVRSAVPRAWVRARRTLLSADGVVFLAAMVLYLMAIGSVKGFAFTIGLTTVLDLVIVFMVTHPMLVMAGKWKILNNRALSGLGMVQDAGADVQRSRKQSGTATARGV